MGKRNQITTDLRISAEAQLKTSRNFISQLEKISDKFDFGEKINTQILNAQNQLKGFNKILEKMQGKSVISDDELKNIVKAGKDIASLIAKTEKLYSGMSTNELQKYSKAYIAQIKAQEEAALKIKQEYQEKTGKVYDKEIKNLDKYENKIVDLQKQIKALNDSKDDTIDNAIKKENARLQEQFDLLQKVKKTQNELKSSKNDIYAESSARTGFSEKELKSKVSIERVDVAKDVANVEYKNLLSTYQAISKERDEILKATTDTSSVERALIQLAEKYHLANVQTTEEFERQFSALEKQKNFYRLLQNRNQLATEEKITAEIERRNALLREQKRIADEIAASQAGILGDNGFESTKQMNSQARNAREVLNGKNVQLTVDGASLTEQGEDDITTQISNSIKQNTDRMVTELKKAQEGYDDLKEPMDKLATQSERAADEQDIIRGAKAQIDATDNDGINTRRQVAKTEQELSAQIAQREAWGAREPIQQTIQTISNGLITTPVDKLPTHQMDMEDLKDLERVDELLNGVDSAFLHAQANLERYHDMLGSEMEPKEYGIIAEQALKELDIASKTYETINATYLKVAQRQKDKNSDAVEKLYKHNSKGQRILDNDGLPVAKKGKNAELTQMLKERDEINGVIASVTNTQTQFEEVYEGSRKQLVQINGVLHQNTKHTKDAADGFDSLSGPAQRASNNIQKAAQQTQYLGSTFDDIRNKVGYFLSLNYVFDMMTQKIREAVQTTKDMDKDMTQIGLVLGKTSTQVWKNFGTYSAMAERLNTTTSQVTNSMKLFYQQGLNTAEVNKMVEASAIAAALGESTLAEASETLTSILNSYNLNANKAMEVTDKISQIAIVSAADFGELSTAIEKVASSAASAGLDLDHMMGYLAKMIETTREAPTNIGTALKTIVANFTQFKEDPSGLTEEGSEINKVDKALKTVGISLTDTNGEVRDLGDVLDELGQQWDRLDRNQRAYLATAIAGTRQQSRFYALMNDYERTLELVAEGSNSAGKAQQQFALYSNSLEAATNRLTNQWERFFNDITQGNGLISKLTNGLTFLMKIVNQIGPIGSALGLTSLIVSTRKTINWFSNLSDALKENKNIINNYQDTLNSINSNKKLKDDEKKKRSDEAKEKYNTDLSENEKVLQQMGPAVAKYRKEIEQINAQHLQWSNNIETNGKHFKKLRLTGVKALTGLKKGLAGVPLALEQIKLAIGSLVKQFAIMIAVNLAIQGIGKVFEVVKTGLGINTEAYVENAEKAKENADNVKELTSEYEELSKKVSLTAEEQERLKEITEEVTAIDAKLGQQLKENAGNYEENIRLMKEYSRLQEVIAAQETIKAIKGEASELNIGAALSTFWTELTGSQSDKDTLKRTEQNNWRSLSQARGQEAGLDNKRLAMLSRYTERLVQWQENQDWTGATYKYNTDEFDGIINKFIDKLELLNNDQLSNYETIISAQSDETISLNKYAEMLQNTDIPHEIKVVLEEDLNNLKNQVYNYIQNNPDILEKNKDAAYTNALNLPQNVLKQIVEYDASGLNSEEKSQYDIGLARFLQDEEAVKGYTAAMEQGTDALDAYIRELINTNKITSVFGETLLQVAETAALIEPAQTALESLIDYIDNTIKTGKISQTEILQGLLDNKIALEDIQINDVAASAGTGDMTWASSKFMTVSMKPYLDQMNSYIDTILKPLSNKIATQETDISTMKTYGNSYEGITQQRSQIQDQINELKTQREQAKADLEVAKEEESKVMNQFAYKDFTIGGNGSPISNITGKWWHGEKNRDNVDPQKATGYFGTYQMPMSTQDGNITFITGPDGQQQAYDNAIKKTDEAQNKYDELGKQIEELEADYGELGTQLEDITNKTHENAGEAEDLSEETKEVIKAMEDEKKATEELYAALELIMKADIKPMEDFTSVFNQFALMGEVDSQLESMQAAWDMTQESMQDYRQVAAMIAEDPSLINAIDMEAEHLQFSDEALEAHAKNVLQAELKSVESKIKGTEAIIALLEGQTDSSDAWKSATTEDISEAIAYSDSLTEEEQNSTEQEATELTTSISNWSTWSTEIQTAIKNVAEARAQMVKEINSESETTSVNVKDIKGSILSGSGADGDEGDITKDDIKSKLESLYTDESGNVDDGKRQALLERYKNTKTILEKLKGSLQKDINNVGGLFKRNSGNGGGSDDEFEPVIEKLEKFYNYLRQLEELEARINRIREKRNLIDTSKTYYIDKLQQENDLLREQQSIYNSYIRDQGVYLQELQQQIQSQFGDWAYFNEDGVIQVKQTEFTANSEEEEERLNLFLELVGLYQDEYNTREENINTLYDLEHSQLENIQEMYDKVLARIQDINDALNRQADLLDHQSTMSFSNIGKFGIMDDKALVAVEGLKKSQAYLNDYEGQIKALGDEVRNGPFSELLVWDETLQVWRTNEEALNDPAIVKKYEAMGYTWQDIDTYCRSVAVKSQSIRDSWNETEDAANAFAELLKSLIDDRISLIQDLFGAATDELNKVFDTFDSKITDLDNQNDLFGTTSESLEEKYLTLVTAATVLKQTIQSLEDNRGSIIERIQKDYPEYIEMINGIAVVNKQAIEESNNLSDEQKAELLQLYGVLEAADGQITEMNDKLIDYFNNMMEMEEAKREAIIEMKQAVHDELMARDQEEIDNLQAKYDKMSQLDDEYYSELQQRVNDARDLRDRRQESANIGQMQARLAVLKADNSGTYNSELIELQKQIQQALQTQADNDVNRELERIQREQQQREEDRQLTISAMENVLTFKDDNNWYWQEAQRIWDEGPESVTGFLRSSREYANISDEQRNKLFEDLTTSMNTAFTTLQTAAGQTAITSDGVVTNQTNLIMDDLNLIQQQLGEGSTLATKIDWSNTQNVNKLTDLDSTVTGLPNTIKTNMDTLFNEKIQPDVNGVVNTISSYLGTDSAIWKKLDGMNTNLGTLTSTKYYDNLNGIVNALTGSGENSIASILKTSKTEYLKSTGDIYKWLDETYRKEHAPEPETKTEATVTPPSNTGGGSSGSNSGGGSGSGAGNSVTTAPSLTKGSSITVKPGTRWYYDSYGTNPSGTARGGKIFNINTKGSHPYNIDGLGWIKKTDIVGYSKGGYVDYTGIANVHGSSTSPEAFLNAKQTRLFEALRDNLTKTASNRVYDKTDDEITKEEYNIDNINIQVQQIADVDAIDKVTKRVKEEIYKDSIGHNNMAVRRR